MNYRCSRCERFTSEPVWLELSFATNKYYPEGECPDAESQGCFPFGAACAAKELQETCRWRGRWEVA